MIRAFQACFANRAAISCIGLTFDRVDALPTKSCLHPSTQLFWRCMQMLHWSTFSASSIALRSRRTLLVAEASTFTVVCDTLAGRIRRCVAGMVAISTVVCDTLGGKTRRSRRHRCNLSCRVSSTCAKRRFERLKESPNVGLGLLKFSASGNLIGTYANHVFKLSKSVNSISYIIEFVSEVVGGNVCVRPSFQCPLGLNSCWIAPWCGQADAETTLVEKRLKE